MPFVLTTTSDGIGRVTINRPKEKNALNRETVALLTSSFKKLGDDKDTRCIIFSGEGEEAFCAGADLRELDEATPDEKLRMFQGVAGLIETITRCPKPIIAQVHGYALAGGCGLVAASDIAVISDEAILGITEIKVGIAPMIILAPLALSVSHKHLSDLALTGRRISGSEAVAMGIGSRLVAKSDVNKTTLEIATEISHFNSDAIAVAKRALLSVRDDLEYYNSLPKLAETIGALSNTESAKEGIAAFLEKRKPKWK